MNNVLTTILYTILFFVCMTLVITTCGMCDNAVEVVNKEFAPSEMLRKYEWFKDASAQLDQKQATLQSYEGRFTSMKETYAQDSLNRRAWDRTDKDQWNIWQSEYLGIKASYNDLAAQYNGAMAKFNYAFCNAGMLPQGATVVLPRQYKPYITQ